MSKQRSAIRRVIRSARAPYSHMDEKDARLFYDTMNALLVYANERLHVVDPADLRERPDTPCMLYEHGGQVAEVLWRHRSLVDDFVREGPLGVSEEQLACAAPWRHALRDTFTVIDASEDRALYMNDDRIFVVGASQDPADCHVHHIPSLMLLTLLPFKGGIVTDGKTLHLSPRPYSWAVPLIAEQAMRLAERPPVSTADELISYTRDLPDGENRLSPRLQRELDRAFESGALV